MGQPRNTLKPSVLEPVQLHRVNELIAQHPDKAKEITHYAFFVGSKEAMDLFTGILEAQGCLFLPASYYVGLLLLYNEDINKRLNAAVLLTGLRIDLIQWGPVRFKNGEAKSSLRWT